MFLVHKWHIDIYDIDENKLMLTISDLFEESISHAIFNPAKKRIFLQDYSGKSVVISLYTSTDGALNYETVLNISDDPAEVFVNSDASELLIICNGEQRRINLEKL